MPLVSLLAGCVPVRPGPTPPLAESRASPPRGSDEGEPRDEPSAWAASLGRHDAQDLVADILGRLRAEGSPAVVYAVWLDDSGRPTCRPLEVEPWNARGPGLEGVLQRLEPGCPDQRPLALHFAYGDGVLDLHSPEVGAACPSFGPRAVVSPCRSSLQLLGATDDEIRWDGGSWYRSEGACVDGIARDGASAMDLGACAEPIARALREPDPPGGDVLAGLVRRRGAVFRAEEHEGSFECVPWRFVRRGADVELVSRRVRRSLFDGAREVHEVSYGVLHGGLAMTLLGPHGRVLRRGREVGSLSYGCAETLFVQPADDGVLLVAGEPWYPTRDACELALSAARAEGGDLARILGLDRPAC